MPIVASQHGPSPMASPLSPAEPRGIPLLPATALSWARAGAVLLALALLSLAFRPGSHVYDSPLTEDGYYALAVARNVALGNGVTIDGVMPTNGFQPLFTFIEAIAFKLSPGDEILAMRLVMALAWLFHLGGAVMVGLIARDAWPVRAPSERPLRLALGALLYLAAPFLFGHAYNGLETGAVLFFYAALGRWVQTGRDDGLAGLAGLGALIGLTVLARIDAGFVAVALAVRELWRSRHRPLGTIVLRLAVLGGAAVLISSPWWLYNLLWFGSAVPTSGLAQQGFALSSLRLEFAEWALRLAAVPWIFLGAHEDWATSLARSLILAGALWVGWRSLKRSGGTASLDQADPAERLTVRRTLGFALAFAAAMAGLVAYYFLGFVAYWFYYRYFAPVALFAFVAAPVAWAALAARTPAWSWSAAGQVLVGIALVAQSAMLVALAHDGRGFGGNTVYHDQVALVREHVPPEEWVAGGQTGTLGFFRERVVNLDGKVNRDALAYQDHMWDYLKARGVRWFADWPHYYEKYLGDPPERHGWTFVAERNYFYLYRYDGQTER